MCLHSIYIDKTLSRRFDNAKLCLRVAPTAMSNLHWKYMYNRSVRLTLRHNRMAFISRKIDKKNLHDNVRFDALLYATPFIGSIVCSLVPFHFIIAFIIIICFWWHVSDSHARGATRNERKAEKKQLIFSSSFSPFSGRFGRFVYRQREMSGDHMKMEKNKKQKNGYSGGRKNMRARRDNGE